MYWRTIQTHTLCSSVAFLKVTIWQLHASHHESIRGRNPTSIVRPRAWFGSQMRRQAMSGDLRDLEQKLTGAMARYTKTRDKKALEVNLSLMYK